MFSLSTPDSFDLSRIVGGKFLDALPKYELHRHGVRDAFGLRRIFACGIVANYKSQIVPRNFING